MSVKSASDEKGVGFHPGLDASSTILWKHQLLKGEDHAESLRRNVEFSDDWIGEIFGAGLGVHMGHAWIPVDGDCTAGRVYRDRLCQ